VAMASTVIDGTGANDRVFDVAGTSTGTVSAKIFGLTIRNGNSGTESGGGVLVGQYGSLTLSRVRVSHNTSGSDGGGIYNSFGSLWLSDSDVYNNQANIGGGL